MINFLYSNIKSASVEKSISYNFFLQLFPTSHKFEKILVQKTNCKDFLKLNVVDKYIWLQLQLNPDNSYLTMIPFENPDLCMYNSKNIYEDNLKKKF